MAGARKVITAKKAGSAETEFESRWRDLGRAHRTRLVPIACVSTRQEKWRQIDSALECIGSVTAAHARAGASAHPEFAPIVFSSTDLD